MLFRTNFSLLCQKIQNVSKSLAMVKASWVGRIPLSKMFLLPHILYFFRTLPLPILQSDLAKLQNFLNHFIWGTWKPCIKFSLLCIPRNFAGLGSPNLKLFYKATILDQAKKWCSKTSKTPWLQVKTSAPTQDPSLILTVMWLGFQSALSFLSAINVTVSTWKALHQHSSSLHPQALTHLPVSAF